MTLFRARPIVVLLAVFALLGAVFAVTTPLFEASDELWHYPMVQQLSRGGPLPVQDPANVGAWRQEASQPPLYYYLMGWATAWIDTRDMAQVRWLNPHVDNGIVTPDGNTNLAVHTAAERWPWRGTVLAVRLARLLSVLMSAGTVLFTYLLAREFFDDKLSSLLAAALVAFTQSGSTARLISMCRTRVPVLALTPLAATARRCCLYWGVVPVLIPAPASSEAMRSEVTRVLQERGWVQPGDLIVITSGTVGHTGTTDTIRLQTVT